MFFKVLMNEFDGIFLNFADDWFLFEHIEIPATRCTIIIQYYLIGFIHLKRLAMIHYMLDSRANRLVHMNFVINSFPHIIIIMLWLWRNISWIDDNLSMIIQREIVSTFF